MRINTNVGALTAAGNLGRTNDAVRTSAEKLSSGFRINKASDDAAGLGVANLFRSDIRALTQSQRNAEQAQSVLQIAEGGATAVQKMLERMKELAAQAASDSVDSAGRARIQLEYTSLVDEIDRVGKTTEFQGSKLLTGAYGATYSNGFTVGGNVSNVKYSTDAGLVTFSGVSATVAKATGAGGVSQTVAYAAATAQTLSFSAFGISFDLSAATASTDFDTKIMTTAAGSGTFLIGAARNSSATYASNTSNTLTISGSALDLSTTTLTVGAAAKKDVTTLIGAQSALSAVDVAMAAVNTALGSIGANQNRLTNAIDSVKSTIANYQAAESAVRDLDMAAEMVNFSKNQILQTAGQAMLGNLNNSAQGVARMLQNL
ncbi:MAG: flagellin [Gemmatimonadota bacterium]|nr:flagellin [Gemmatimonadota bacterium]